MPGPKAPSEQLKLVGTLWPTRKYWPSAGVAMVAVGGAATV